MSKARFPWLELTVGSRARMNAYVGPRSGGINLFDHVGTIKEFSSGYCTWIPDDPAMRSTVRSDGSWTVKLDLLVPIERTYVVQWGIA